MAWVAAGELFRTDWKNKDAVIRLAKKLGPGMTVIKYHHRDNYNVTHTSTLTDKRVQKWGSYDIIHQT